jgi:predicted Co/Zn/Cd cation transporter (cation efflux family)
MTVKGENQPIARPHLIEAKSLLVSKWANLFMGVCGIVAAWLSNSEAILMDGLFSGIGFIAAVFAARVGASVNQPPDRIRPFGYDADEAIYTTFRSMSLIGLIVFAVISAIMKIATYALGGEVPELVFGPIIIYFFVISFTCVALAVLHHVNWRRTGKSSEILKLEKQAAIVDGAITTGAGIGLLAIPFLAGTPFAWIVPIGDSVVLLVLCTLVTMHPIVSFKQGMAQLAGVSADPATLKKMRRIISGQIGDKDIRLVDASVNKIGRNFTVAVYIEPAYAITADEIDQFTLALEEAANNALGSTRVYTLISGHGRAWNK